jgi:hypothetical protein
VLRFCGSDPLIAMRTLKWRRCVIDAPHRDQWISYERHHVIFGERFVTERAA